MLYHDFSKLFHQSSKDLTAGGTARIPKDSNIWPQSWKTTTYKTYESALRIPLEREKYENNLFDLIEQRSSTKQYSDIPISRIELSSLLLYSCGITGTLPDGRPRRASPSAGALYPLEIYPIVIKKGGDVLPGLYHYNLRDHSLDLLWQKEFSKADLDRLTCYEWVNDASVILVMTTTFHRLHTKYKERGYRYALIEAGHIGQNIYLVAEALGLACCAIGGTRDENLEDLVDIDGTTESVVYTLALGRKQ